MATQSEPARYVAHVLHQRRFVIKRNVFSKVKSFLTYLKINKAATGCQGNNFYWIISADIRPAESRNHF